MKVKSGKLKVKSNNLKLKYLLLIIVYFTFNFGFLTFNSREARAQSLSLSISPPLLEVMIRPGKSITQVFKLVNGGETTVVTTRLLPYSEFGVVEDKNYKIEPWISLLNQDVSFDKPFMLPTGEEKQIILRLNPPRGTPEQDYYRVLLFTTTPIASSEVSQSAISQSLGSILLVNVTSTGLVAKGALITKFELPSVIDSFGPLNTKVEVRNTGTTYFRPIGQINLTGPVGRASFKIEPRVILAGQERILSTDPSFPLTGFFLGKYQMEVAFSLDEGTIKLEQTKKFYAIPWKAGLVTIGVTIIIIVFNKKKKRKVKT